jgi:hypothetical protein
VGLRELLGVCLRRSEIVYDRLKNLGKMIPKLLCAELDGIGCLRFGECHRVVEDFRAFRSINQPGASPTRP